MASPLPEQPVRYPLAAYNFRVTVGGASVRFAKVSGLWRERQSLTYRDGLSFLDGERIVTYFVDRYVTVTMEQGTVSGDDTLYRWLEQPEIKVVEIQLCNAEGTPVLGWRIEKAIAVKLSAPTFDATSNGVAIDTLEIKAAGITQVDLR